ncbi:MAG: hypothetical protein HN509_10275 [Halobacteriovoraceae bacterium]|jgi:hypothetical protein|nr:hypothetical protein [Halobacteriovoraceae bacterium]MBT5094387.1 hypothetical protein [Halobacteriovoraceae bacterium]
MSFVFVIGFIFMFLKVSMNYTNGYLVHYATFMASRAYLVLDNNSNDPAGADGPAAAEAKKVFESFKLDAFIPGFPNVLNVNSPSTVNGKPFIGAWTEYEDDFSFATVMGGNEKVKFISEAFLLREPIRAGCLERVCRGMVEIGSRDSCDFHTTLVDNGC